MTTANDMQQCYVNTFASPEGRKVLGDILELGHVFVNTDPHDVVMATERNMALTIARTARAFDLVYSQLGIEVVPQQQPANGQKE